MTFPYNFLTFPINAAEWFSWDYNCSVTPSWTDTYYYSATQKWNLRDNYCPNAKIFCIVKTPAHISRTQNGQYLTIIEISPFLKIDCSSFQHRSQLEDIENWGKVVLSKDWILAKYLRLGIAYSSVVWVSRSSQVTLLHEDINYIRSTFGNFSSYPILWIDDTILNTQIELNVQLLIKIFSIWNFLITRQILYQRDSVSNSLLPNNWSLITTKQNCYIHCGIVKTGINICNK